MTEGARVSVIGNFFVTLPEGKVAEFRTTRAAEVVALLTLSPGRRKLRSEVAAAIWPDADRSARLNNLRPALNYARTALGSAESIESTDDSLTLSDSIESDWSELSRLEIRVQQASTSDERLVQLYSLNNLIQRPLLANWECEWLETPRQAYDQRRLNSLRQLSEELGSRGEWSAALDSARRISELDRTSDDGVRLQLRFLGELDRPKEAQRVFAHYARQLDTELGLTVNPALKQFAEDVAAGRYRSSGTKTLNAVQHEIIFEMMAQIAEDEPKRLLPLLASPKLNWSLVFHGAEMRPILQRALDATTGWTPERCGVAKRLLQVYSQERQWPELLALSNDLLQSDDLRDKVACLNFQAFERLAESDYPAALAIYDQAVAFADKAEDSYLGAVSIANRAILNIHFELYRLGLEELRQVQNRLAERKEQNARFGTSVAKGWVMAATLADGKLELARQSAQDWRHFAETNGTVAYDSYGKLMYGAVLAATEDRSARDWLVAGIDTAFINGQRIAILESIFPVIYGLNALKMEHSAARQTRRVAKEAQYRITPFQKRLSESTEHPELREDHLLNAAELLGYCREKLLAAS